MKIYMKDNLCTIYKLVFHKMQQFFIRNAQLITDNPEEADLIITGLCAAFNADEERSAEIVSVSASYKKRIYAFGCLTRVNPQRVKADKMFASWQAKDLVENVVTNPLISWESIQIPSEFRTKEDYRVYNPKKMFVPISTGCSFECSYCPHKLGAGNSISRPLDDILNQAQELINRNIETIILTGIDTASYGKDGDVSFSRLLQQILDLCKNNANFHIAQFNPEGLIVDGDILLECCQDQRIRDIQLPIQTCSPRILKLMNRNYTIDGIKRFITEVKSKNSEVMFRTDLMVGFPTETQEELDESICFAVDYFDEVTVYGYEFKKNTSIAKYNLKLFDENEIKRRQEYATQRVKSKGLLVHSGGQILSSLMEVDCLKEKIRGK
jgi:tRNA A37 methylthiotransferase MiaB